MNKDIQTYKNMMLDVQWMKGADASSSPQNVAVEFCAMLPDRVVTRAAGDLMVDQVVCAVFYTGKEVASLRRTPAATSGTPTNPEGFKALAA